jgi:hypothetical protein
MFHVVYSRDYWDTENQGTFANTWTLYRNVSYFKLREMQKAIPSLLKNADEVYTAYQAKNNPNVSNENFIRSEVYVVDDSDYFKTYKDVYPDTYQLPPGLIPEEEDYYDNYGQKCQFMLLKDFNENYTWFAKDFTQKQINELHENNSKGKDIYSYWRKQYNEYKGVSNEQ